MMTADGITKFATAIGNTITRCECTISGTVKNLPIQSTQVVGDTVQVNIYLDDTLQGTVTEARLYDNVGTLLASRPDSISKPATKALLLVFKFKISET